jgi:hypothetical protein
VVGAREHRGVALVVPADLHPSVPAGVEEHVDLLALIAREDDRLLAHARDEIVAGPGNLALVADEEPRAREDPLLLPRVDLVVDEELAADDSALEIDQRACVPPAVHRRVPPRSVEPAQSGAARTPR